MTGLIEIPQNRWFDAERFGNFRIIDNKYYKFVEAPPSKDYILCVEVLRNAVR